MKTYYLLILSLFSLKFVSAQTGIYLSDIQGKPFIENTATNISGSPFLLDEFILGTVTVKDGFTYDYVPLKFNALTNELFFKDSKSEVMLSFIEPIKSFKIGPNNYLNGFPEIDNFNMSSFYQVIFNGNVKLLFKISKIVVEYKPYNSATIERKYEDSKTYYIFKDGKMIRFKPSKNEFLEIFKDKNSEIEMFMKKEKVDVKNNIDLAKVFEYYSSL